MTSKWILPPEEWAFFAKNRTDLIKELQCCWIPDEDLDAACLYEFSRENFRRDGEKEGGFGLPKSEFEELVRKPFPRLNCAEKDIVRSRLSSAVGWYGEHHIQYLTPQNSLQYGLSSDSVMSLYINWGVSDYKLIKSFTKLLKDKRPIFMPEKINQGRKGTKREMLKALVAYKLLRALKGPKPVLSQIGLALSDRASSKAFYSSDASLKEAASRAESKILPLFRLNDVFYDIRKRSFQK